MTVKTQPFKGAPKGLVLGHLGWFAQGHCDPVFACQLASSTSNETLHLTASFAKKQVDHLLQMCLSEEALELVAILRAFSVSVSF